MRKLCMLELVLILCFGSSIWISIHDHVDTSISTSQSIPKVDFWGKVLYFTAKDTKNVWARFRKEDGDVVDFAIPWDTDHLTAGVNISDHYDDISKKDTLMGITVKDDKVIGAVEKVQPVNCHCRDHFFNFIRYSMSYFFLGLFLAVRRTRFENLPVTFGAMPFLAICALAFPFWGHKAFIMKGEKLRNVVIAPPLDQTVSPIDKFCQTVKRLKNAYETR